GPGGPGDHGPGGPGDHGPGGPGDHRPGGPAGPGGPGAWHGDDHRGYFHSAPWGDGPAPWGAGEPPRPAWDRPLPPPGGSWNYGPINYWGYQETPVWNPQFNQFGFDFFGVWIPL
ncbi:MAG: chitin-binding protein, partial [Mycobacterium sp.]